MRKMNLVNACTLVALVLTFVLSGSNLALAGRATSTPSSEASLDELFNPAGPALEESKTSTASVQTKKPGLVQKIAMKHIVKQINKAEKKSEVNRGGLSGGKKILLGVILFLAGVLIGLFIWVLGVVLAVVGLIIALWGLLEVLELI